MSYDVAIVGIGMVPFGRHPDTDIFALGANAARLALADARVAWSDVQVAYGGSRSTNSNADSVVRELGLSGLHFTNIRNGCATGTSALVSACNAIEARQADLAMVIGFDKHPRGAFAATASDYGLDDWYGETGMLLTTQFFAMKAARYMHDHGVSQRTLGLIAEKNFANGARNERAWRRTPFTAAQILESPPVNDPLTQYMFCNPSDGAVAVILASRSKARELERQPVWIRGAAVRTRQYGSLEVFNPHATVDGPPSPTVEAVRVALQMAGVGPSEIDIAQLQDTDSGSELIHMAESGLCHDGEQEELLANGETHLDGRLPINTDGGCMANGEPVAASGLRQVFESTLQLRGEAGDHQVARQPATALVHVYGAPGISASAVLTR